MTENKRTVSQLRLILSYAEAKDSIRKENYRLLFLMNINAAYKNDYTP